MAHVRMEAADLVVDINDESMNADELADVADAEMQMMMQKWVSADESLIKCSPQHPTFSLGD
ncbi:hypothetical protein [Natronosalvus amylolyticus]|uniref:hypothetical protein n=1 Tax=Natronosalvus amylolyticus TaxID=2961994 RepID=UPI0020C9F836|nr:hypothetical protein [Natronosalvus amylolyticus]